MNDACNTSPLADHTTATVMITGDETDGVFALVAVTLPPYATGAAVHRHLHHAEGCYVIEGTLALTQNDRTTILAAGCSTFIPAGVLHTCWNPTAAPTVMLLIYRPGVTEAEAVDLARGLSGS